MGQKIILPILLSILITVGLIFSSFFIVGQLLSIHKFMLLKWLPLSICIIAFSIAGVFTKKVSLRFLPLVFLPLILFKPYQHLQFPFALILLLISLLTVLLFREEIRKNVKIGMLFLLVSIFTYHLFSQPLIIEKKGFGYTTQGDLINAIVLWDFSPASAKQLPDHQLTQVNGKPLNLNSLMGKRIYLSFWATWCAPCLKQKPELEALKQRYQGDSSIVFVDISLDHQQKKWHAYLDQHQPLGLQLIANEIEVTRSLLAIGALPTRIIASVNGKYKECNSLTLADQLLATQESVEMYVESKE